MCPVCQSPMKHKDWRRRHIRKEGGEKYWGKIRRLYCEKCHRLHNELPSCLSPYKHYDVEVIEGVVDDVTASDIANTEDHPCEKTMERWKAWVEHNRPFIEGYIRSVGYRILGFGEAFLKACGSVLDWMRGTYHDNERHWLTMVNQIVYNTGSSLEPWPPFWSSSAP